MHFFFSLSSFLLCIHRCVHTNAWIEAHCFAIFLFFFCSALANSIENEDDVYTYIHTNKKKSANRAHFLDFAIKVGIFKSDYYFPMRFSFHRSFRNVEMHTNFMIRLPLLFLVNCLPLFRAVALFFWVYTRRFTFIRFTFSFRWKFELVTKRNH